MTSSRDLSAEVTTLSAEVERLKTIQLRAEAEAAAAQAEYERALERLRGEFGVDSLTAAKALLESLDVQVAQELDRVRSGLAVANGSS